MTDTAQAAADAARATRELKIQEALNAFWFDHGWITEALPTEGEDVTHAKVQDGRHILNVCLAHLDELTRLIAQRDGMPVSDGPDVGERRYG